MFYFHTRNFDHQHDRGKGYEMINPQLLYVRQRKQHRVQGNQPIRWLTEMLKCTLLLPLRHHGNTKESRQSHSLEHG